MIDTPHIARTATQRVAVIRLNVPRAEIRNVMGPGYQELMATIAAQGVAAAGPWFTHHFRTPGETFDFELGVPVPAAILAAGRVQPGELRATTVARTVYRGPYEGLGGAWAQFMEWIAAQGHSPDADLWECYVAGPESGSDRSKWQTELNRPLTRTMEKS
jgi:effector-binding domain-containing protein